MHKEGYIDFLLIATVEGMHFQPQNKEGFEFLPYGSDDLRIVLQPTKPEDDACGHWSGLTCKVYKSFLVTENQRKFITAYIE